MSKKHKLDASHPGVGKSKIMKKLWKAWARDYVDVAMPKKKEWMRHLDAFAALARSMPKPNEADQSENPYIFKPRQHGIGKSAVIMMDEWDRNGLTFEQQSLLHPLLETDRWLVEDLDTNATCWDDQMDEMCRDFYTLRDRLAYVKDNDRLKLVDELLHRIVDVRCQLDTMKKEQS
jgi:hypothetical protein